MAANSKPQLSALHHQILIELATLGKPVSLATLMTGVNIAYVLHAGQEPFAGSDIRGACLELQFLGLTALDMQTGNWSITDKGKAELPKDTSGR